MIKLAHAVYDENGKSSGGKPGDQTGKELAIWDFYISGKGWQAVIRPKKTNIANVLSDNARKIVANKHVGYNQYNRTSLYNELTKVGFNVDKLVKDCDCDCSSLVAMLCIIAGLKVPYSMCTANQLSYLERTGAFEILTDKKYLTSAKYLKDGDILWRQGHTAIAVEITTVKDLQVALNTFGYGLVEDGIRGKKTNNAIADLHKRIQTVDKIIASL